MLRTTGSSGQQTTEIGGFMHNRGTETKKIFSWGEKPVRPLKSVFTDLNRGWEEDGSGFEKEAKIAVKGIC